MAEEQGEKPLEFNPSNLTVFRSKPSNPSNILNGTKKGVANLTYGIVGALGLILVMPFAGAKSGYESYGIVGAVGGTFAGALGGVVGAVGALLTGLCSFLYYTSLGLIRTPTALLALMQGKQWDKDAEEWVDYDMAVESDILFSITEETFIEHIKEKKTATDLYSPSRKQAEANRDGSAAEGTRPVRKKIVQDRTFYDTLGVEPEATASEIKKAYYLLAKRNHPDRNPGNAEAKANFQRISQAYEVLGDENLRLAYDTRGKSAVEGQTGIEASMLYTLIFGSENFETIIGELQLATQIKLMTEPTKPTEVLRFRQRVRELKCAVVLAARLDAFMEGDEQVFREKAQNEAKELSESPLGGTLLGLIGRIYVERACAHLSTTAAAYMYAGKTLSGVASTFHYISWGFSAAWYGLELRSLKADAERRQAEEDKRNNVSEAEARARRAAAGPGDMKALYGPNPSPEHRQRVQEKAKKFGNSFLGLLWQVTKSDIEETLKHVCNKVLLDHSVTPATRRRRAETLLLLGEQYVLHTVRELDGIQDFLERIGKQTGIFSEETPDFGAFARKDGSAEDGETRRGRADAPPGAAFFSDAFSREALLQIQSHLGEYSVRELKEHIAALGGSGPAAARCIEKEDLRMYLNELLLIRLSAMEPESESEQSESEVEG